MEGFQPRPGAGIRRRSKASPKTDMTPMVDLGFLLISFFVITTEMSKPATTDLFMPRHDGGPTHLGESGALTFLLTKNNTVYYYHGDWQTAISNNKVLKTHINYKSEIRKLIIDKQLTLDKAGNREGRSTLMFLIKPGGEAEYGNIIDMLDEALIHGVKKYAILPLLPDEAEFLAKPDQ